MKELHARRHIVRLRVNDEELAYMKSKAERAGLDVANYVRRAALQRRDSPRSVLLEELATLNCRLLMSAETTGQQLDLERVAEEIAQLAAMVERGESR